MIEGTDNPQEMHMNFGQRLQAALDYANEQRRKKAEADGRPFVRILQRDVARVAGVTPGTVSGWIKNPPKDPGGAGVAMVARLLGVSNLWLTTERGPMVSDDLPDDDLLTKPSAVSDEPSDGPDAAKLIAIMEAAAEAFRLVGELPGDRKLIEVACHLYPHYDVIDEAARDRIVKTLTATIRALR